jgi:hypothetical protein
MLERLAGLDSVPAVRGTFTIGEHHFLALEYVDCRPLASAIVDRCPLIQLNPSDQALRDYTDWALAMQGKVEAAVRVLHDRGVVMGDLHPYNVLLRPDGRIVLLDFEVSSTVEEGRRQTLADPGFAAPRSHRGLDLDRWALACLRLFLFLPLTTLLVIDPRKAEDLTAAIAELFPVPDGFLDEALDVILGRPADRSPRPRRTAFPLDPEHNSWECIRDSLAGAILASATPAREDRLFPGDIAQFDAGGLSLSYGAAGVLYALDVTGTGRYPDHEQWLLRQATDPKLGTTRLGLYDGLHGVAHVLEHLGHRPEALKVLDICTDELTGKWERLPLHLHGGLAGIGLNLVHFGDVTGDPSPRQTALRMAQVIADRLGDDDAHGTLSGGTHPFAGLMYGSAGPALLFLRLFEQTGEPALLDLARTALRQDLGRCVTRSDGAMEVDEGWRTMPYLADGSVGIGMVLDHFLVHRPDEQFTEAAAGIRLAATSPFYIEPGLFHGRAGMILYLAHLTERDERLVAAHLRRLAWHAIRFQEYTAFPGEELLRLSMDLATGTAGVLLAAGAALHTSPVHLPFLAPPSSLPA